LIAVLAAEIIAYFLLFDYNLEIVVW